VASHNDVDVPEQVRDYSNANGFGVALFTSPQDQSTCNHVTADLMIAESSIVDGRCHFFEPFGGSNSWVLLDRALEAPEVSASYEPKEPATTFME